MAAAAALVAAALAPLWAPSAAVVTSLLLAVAALAAALLAWLWRLLKMIRQPKAAAYSPPGGVVTALKLHGLQLSALDAPADAVAVSLASCCSADHAEVLALLAAHGAANSYAYTVFSNPEMQVLLARGLGWQPYTVARAWGRTVVAAVGDPVCAPQHAAAVLAAFRGAFPDGIFVDVGRPAAAALVAADPQLCVTDVGPETVIDVAAYSFELNKKTKHIRRRADMAARAGLVVEEVTAASPPEMRAAVAAMAAAWQADKACTGDIRVFSRAVPLHALGQERDVRVFVARTLSPDEPPPLTVAGAAALLQAKQQQQQQHVAAAPGSGGSGDGAISGGGGGNGPQRLSRKQRKLQERVQRARSLRNLAESSSQQQPEEEQQPEPHRQQPRLQPVLSGEPASAAPLPPAGATATFEVVAGSPRGRDASSASLATTATSLTTATSGCSSSLGDAELHAGPGPDGSSTSASASTSGIHACVVFDPVYRGGSVVGYIAERSFLRPGGSKGAVKLVLREALVLLRAEGRQLLSLGLAVGYQIQPAAARHGFEREVPWLYRAFQLCYEHGNDLYAFKNLADAKSSWGGGYDPQADAYKHSAVHLHRRFAVLTPSWRPPFGDGPFLMAVFFRHVGVLGDPWDLFAFWRYMQPLFACSKHNP